MSTTQYWSNTQKLQFSNTTLGTHTCVHNPTVYNMVPLTKAQASVPAQPGPNVLSGGVEFASGSIPMEWPEMDYSEYVALGAYHLQPSTMIDMYDNGYLGWLVLASHEPPAGVMTKVAKVKATFVVSKPANGLVSRINDIAPGTLSASIQLGGSIAAGVSLNYALSFWSKWGESLASSVVNVQTQPFLGTAAAPTLSQTAGGTLGARTEYYKICWKTAYGTSISSAEVSIAVSANNVAVVTPPAAPAGATGWSVFGSTASGAEKEQNSSALTLGAAWTEPTTGLTTTGVVPTTVDTSSTNNFMVALSWTAPSTTAYRKGRVYVSNSSISPGSSANVKAEVYSAFTQSFNDYCGTNGVTATSTLPTESQSYIGDFRGGIWQNAT